jgi:hypothetical protein
MIVFVDGSPNTTKREVSAVFWEKNTLIAVY